MSLKEEFIKLLERDKEFRYTVAGLLGYRDILERLEKHDQKFNQILKELEEHRKILRKHDEKFEEIISEIQALRKDFLDLSRRVEVTIGSMGRRWGTDLERMVLEIFKEALEEKGITPGKVEKFRYKDVDGSITGVKGRIIDVNILVKNEKIYVIEVKSTTDIEHVELLIDKAKTIEKILKKPVQKVYIVTVNIDKEAYQRARELGIEVIYGNLIT